MGKQRKSVQSDIPVEFLTATLSPKVYAAVERLCKDSLAYGDNHATLRTTITNLYMELSKVSVAQHGYNTPDVVSIMSLLKRTNPAAENGQPVSCDPIRELEAARKLSPAQMGAAATILNVWNGFGRFLSVTARSYDGQGGGGTKQIKSPLDVMGQELWETYKKVYVPWFELAKTRLVPREVGGTVPASYVVLRVVVERHPFAEVDRTYQLSEGRALRTVKRELRMFYEDRPAGSVSSEEVLV